MKFTTRGRGPHPLFCEKIPFHLCVAEMSHTEFTVRPFENVCKALNTKGEGGDPQKSWVFTLEGRLV